METVRHSLNYYINKSYPFIAYAVSEGGYFITYPDLPGCISHAETVGQIPIMAGEAKQGWMECEYERIGYLPEPYTNMPGGYNESSRY